MAAVTVYQRLPWLRPLLLMVGVAASVAAGIGVVLWSRTPDYRILYSGLEQREKAEVVTALQRLNVEYRLDPVTGMVEVPAARMQDVRMQLAGEGLPRSAGTGFDLIGQNPGFGVSEFIENARYQHMLETELAGTISSLQPVQGARVHLAVPKRSAFLRQGHGPSASVVLRLYSGRSLNTNQVEAIENLVASSVPDLKATKVTVVDSDGNLLSRSDDGSGDTESQTDTQFQYTHRLEDSLSAKIENLLTPMLGAGHIHASVVANLDFSRVEQTRESYDPNGKVVRAEQTSEQRQMDSAGVDGGVPGALSNTPPQAAQSVPLSGTTAASQQQSKLAKSKPVTTSSHVTRNYEVDRTISHEQRPTGRIRRLSVAVLVDNLHTVDKRGKVTETPLSKDQLAQVTSLVKDAVGFDPKRGDSVSVMNTTFQSPPAVAAQPVPAWWTRPDVRDIAKNALGILGAVIILFAFVRPMVRGLLQMPEPVSAPALPAADAEHGQLPQPAPMQLGQGSYEERVDKARAMAAQDPKRVAQVVRGWVGNDG